MNKAYVQHRDDGRLSSPSHQAADGLLLLGYEVEWFKQEDLLANKLDITLDTLVVGYINTYRSALIQLGICPPDNIDFPEELSKYLGRKIWKTDLGYVRNEANWPVFAKPCYAHKEFTGKLFTRFSDLISSSILPKDFTVWASEPIRFISEYRCFMHKKEIVDVRHYKGDPLVFPNGLTIKSMADKWTSAPSACCIDVGVTDDGRTLLVEVNDGHSMGDYGLQSIVYARMLETRWCELTGAVPIP